MRKFGFCKKENIYKLNHQLKTVVCFSSITLGKDPVMVNQLSILKNKLNTNKTTFIAKFDRYASFGIKFLYQAKRFLHQFLSGCSNVSDVGDIDFYFINLSHINLSAMRQECFFTLPTSFSRNKIPNDHSQHGSNKKSKKGDHGVIKNQFPNITWKLKNNKDYKEVIMESTLKEFPMFEHNRRFYRRWSSKGYFRKQELKAMRSIPIPIS